MEELLGIALLIILSKMLEEYSLRRGLPPLVGWSLAGIILGPAVMDVLRSSPSLDFLTSIGVYIFFFILGIEEIDVEGILANIRLKHVLASLISFTLTTLTVFTFFTLLGFSLARSLAVAVLAAIPTSSVVAKVLSDLKMLKSNLGLTLFSYTLTGEVAGLIVVGALLEIGGASVVTARSIIVQLGQIFLYFLLAGLAGIYVVPRIVKAVRLYMASRGALVGIIFGLLLLIVGVGESVGVHGVVGALMLGLILSDFLVESGSREALETFIQIGNGFFIPLFFASIGLNFTWDFLKENPLDTLALVVALVPIRLFVHYSVAKALKLKCSWEIASTTLARGSVDLAVLATFLYNGLISGALYSSAVAISLVMLLLYPIIARKTYGLEKAETIEAPPILPVLVKYLLGRMRIRDVMEPPVRVDAELTAREALKILSEKGEEVALITDSEGKELGFATMRKLANNLEEKVKHLAEKPKHIVKQNDNLFLVLEEVPFAAQSYIPAVDEEGRIVGIVTQSTILKALTRGRTTGTGEESTEKRETEEV